MRAEPNGPVTRSALTAAGRDASISVDADADRTAAHRDQAAAAGPARRFRAAPGPRRAAGGRGRGAPPDRGQRGGRLGQDDAGARLAGGPGRAHGLGGARRLRQRPGALLALRLGGARPGGHRARRPGGGRAVGRRRHPRGGPHRADQRRRRGGGADGAGARRPPRRRRALDRRLPGVPGAAPAGQPAAGGDHPLRPAPRPGAPARARRPGRAARRRPALHGPRGGAAAGRRDRRRPAGRRGGAPARPHRGLGRRAVPGGAVAARARRRGRVHRGLRRGRPAGGRLPRGGGAGGTAARAARLPAAHGDPPTPHRPALRRRHRPRGLRRGPDRAGALQPVPGAPRPAPRVVPLPPPLRRAAAPRAHAGGAGRGGGAAPPGVPVVRGERRHGRRDPPRGRGGRPGPRRRPHRRLLGRLRAQRLDRHHAALAGAAARGPRPRRPAALPRGGPHRDQPGPARRPRSRGSTPRSGRRPGPARPATRGRSRATSRRGAPWWRC